MSMNVKTEMTVTLTLCAPTQKDHMFVVVSGIMKVTGEIAQVCIIVGKKSRHPQYELM